jgi:voltage-gated potassium channel
VKRSRLRSRVRALYFGHMEAAVRFQGVLLVLDLLIIGFFVASQFIREQPWFWIVDASIAAFVAIDLAARLFAFGTLRRWFKYPTTWVDLVVLATLALPTVLYNWGFLRILRLWTLVHSERFWNVLARGKWDDTYVEDVAKAVTTLVVFVFIAAGLTQALFLGHHAQLNNFIDAMYFVVTSLTTTGYGDITLASPFGRLFTIALMLVGISLFFTIAQKVFAPQEKIQRCTKCGLDRHSLSANYCCNCGTELTAPLRGRTRAAKSARGKGG